MIKLKFVNIEKTPEIGGFWSPILRPVSSAPSIIDHAPKLFICQFLSQVPRDAFQIPDVQLFGAENVCFITRKSMLARW